MKKNFVAMGEYYCSSSEGLVRTVCRAFDFNSNKPVITYVNINEGGVASEIYFMPEEDFMEKFIK